MGQAIGETLPYGVGVALSPVPIIAVVLMLATPQGRINGPAFLAGWIVGIAGLGTIVLLVASGASASNHGAPATWVSIVKIVLGVLLLALAAKQWRGRPRGDAEPELPAWMRTIDTFTPVKSIGMAVLLSAINPKNLLLVVGGAAAIAQTGVSTFGPGRRARGLHPDRNARGRHAGRDLLPDGRARNQDPRRTARVDGP
jgi:threonine/homoserine/homoserine lactone efflux protein